MNDTRTYYCPSCGKPAEMVEDEPIDVFDEGLKCMIRTNRIHLECHNEPPCGDLLHAFLELPREVMEPTQAACDHCGQLIVENGHDYTNDIMLSTTLYEENGEVRKCMEPTSTDHVKFDYIVICPDCEQELFAAWNELVQKLVTRSRT